MRVSLHSRRAATVREAESVRRAAVRARLAADAARARSDDAQRVVDVAIVPAGARRSDLRGDRAAAAGSAGAWFPCRLREQETAGGTADRIRPADGDGEGTRPFDPLRSDRRCGPAGARHDRETAGGRRQN